MKFKLLPLPLLLLSTLFMSCDPIKGNMTVTEPLNYLDKDKKEIVVPVNSYKTEITFKSDKNFKIKLKDSDGNKFKIKVKSDHDFNFPKYGGAININREDTNQDFDIRGNVNIETTYGDIRDDYESCSETRTVRQCRRNAETGRRVCADKTITEYGDRHVRYQYVYEQRDVELQIVDGDTTFAEMFSRKNTSDKHYLDRGYCRIY